MIRAASWRLIGALIAAALGRHPVLDQGLAGNAQFLEIILDLGVSCPSLQVEKCAHARQNAGINPVSLGQNSRCLGKSTRRARVDLDQSQPCCEQRQFQDAMVRAGRLKDDPCGRNAVRTDPTDQRFAACRIIWKLPVLVRATPKGVQRGFRDIDADGILHCLFHFLCLSSGPKDRVSVQDS